MATATADPPTAPTNITEFAAPLVGANGKAVEVPPGSLGDPPQPVNLSAARRRRAGKLKPAADAATEPMAAATGIPEDDEPNWRDRAKTTSAPNLVPRAATAPPPVEDVEADPDQDPFAGTPEPATQEAEAEEDPIREGPTEDRDPEDEEEERQEEDEARANDPDRYPIPTAWRNPEGVAVQYLRAFDLDDLADELIEECPELIHIRTHAITMDCWWAKKGGTSAGQPITGRMEVQRGLKRLYSKVDVTVTLAADLLYLIGGKRHQVKAALFHELRHIGIKEGKVVVLPHDFVGTGDEVRRFGPWTEGLNGLIEAIKTGGWVQASIDLGNTSEEDEEPDTDHPEDADDQEATEGAEAAEAAYVEDRAKALH